MGAVLLLVAGCAKQNVSENPVLNSSEKSVIQTTTQSEATMQNDVVAPTSTTTVSSTTKIKTDVEVAKASVYCKNIESVVSQESVTDLDGLKKEFKKASPVIAEPFVVTKFKQKDNFYIMSYCSTKVESRSNPEYYVEHANSGWKVIYVGQESPSCDLLTKSNFPKEIAAQCLGNKDGQTTIINR